MSNYDWQPLDPAKADYGAVFGCRGPQGVVALERPDGVVVVVGLYSGGDRARAEREFDRIAVCHPGMVGADRRIKPKVFQSWLMK